MFWILVSIPQQIGKLKERQLHNLFFTPQLGPLVSAKICTGIPGTSVMVNKAVTSKFSTALRDFFSNCSVPTTSSWREREKEKIQVSLYAGKQLKPAHFSRKKGGLVPFVTKAIYKSLLPYLAFQIINNLPDGLLPEKT